MNPITARLSAAGVVSVLLGIAALKTVPGRTVWVPAVPALAQEVPYSCGAAALRMVLARYRFFPSEAELRTALGSGPAHGTAHEMMIAVGENYGLSASARLDATPEELRRAVRRRDVTIIALQAWGDGAAYRAAESGHYVVVAGYRDRRFFFLDPWDGQVHQLDEAELLERWHDVDGDGTPVRRLALFFASSREMPPHTFERMP